VLDQNGATSESEIDQLEELEELFGGDTTDDLFIFSEIESSSESPLKTNKAAGNSPNQHAVAHILNSNNISINYGQFTSTKQDMF